MSFLIRNAPIVIAVVLWEIAGRIGLIDLSLVPNPSQILTALFHHLTAGDLLYHLARSIQRCIVGLAAASIVGVTVGLLMARYRLVEQFVQPLARLIYPLPKVALIPMVMVWFGLGDLSKSFLIFIGCLLPMLVSSYNAARGIEPRLIWSARSLGASERQILTEIILPGILPDLVGGFRTTVGLAFVLMVAGEFIIAKDGIGFQISTLGDGGDYPSMFAAIGLVVLVGFCADRAILWLAGRKLAWKWG